jgi:uncharacterized membrane protein
METTNEIDIQAPIDMVFDLAAAVEEWPRLLPHYRWVRVLERSEEHKLVEMAARRDRIPVRWRAIQRLFPRQARITFQHVGGATRGMAVEWRLTSRHGGTHVCIWHQFRPGWLLVPDALVELVVGGFFVSYIAGQTLRHLRYHAEYRAADIGPPAGSRA